MKYLRGKYEKKNNSEFTNKFDQINYFNNSIIDFLLIMSLIFVITIS